MLRTTPVAALLLLLLLQLQLSLLVPTSISSSSVFLLSHAQLSFPDSFKQRVADEVSDYTEENCFFADIDAATTNGSAPTTFDYIVVGGGTAGLVVAEKLSRTPNTTVAVVEAGDIYERVDPVNRAVPFMESQLTYYNANWDYALDFNYMTENETGLANRSLYYARGKMLGGSSARNFCVYHRGTRGQFGTWAQLTNNSDYEWDAFFPHYKNSTSVPPAPVPPDWSSAEGIPPNQPVYVPDDYGDGPLNISYPTDIIKTFDTWLHNTTVQAGVPTTTAGLSDGQLHGGTWVPLFADKTTKERITTESAYLRPAATRPNLYVFYNTSVKKVLLNSTEGANVTATGVEAVRQGRQAPVKLTATKEVVISGGVFNTPQVLLLSGIGPAAHLQEKGIDVVLDSPQVGQNLMDHIFTAITYATPFETNYNFQINNDAAAKAVDEFVNNGTGPMTSGSEYLSFFSIDNDTNTPVQDNAVQGIAGSSFADDWPSVEFISSPTWIADMSSTATPPSSEPPTQQYGSVLIALVSPKSRGNVTLKTSTPGDAPSIRFNYLTDSLDVQRIVQAFKLMRNAVKNSSTGDENGTAPKEVYPGEDKAPSDDDDAILAAIRKSAMTVWHGGCTARMGKNISDGVLDGRGRVFGVEHLRVTDASAFPLMIPGHPAPTVIALADLVADYILEDAEEKMRT